MLRTCLRLAIPLLFLAPMSLGAQSGGHGAYLIQAQLPAGGVEHQGTPAAFFYGTNPDNGRTYLQIDLGPPDGAKMAAQINFMGGVPVAGKAYPMGNPFPNNQRHAPLHEGAFYALLGIQEGGTYAQFTPAQGVFILESVQAHEIRGRFRFQGQESGRSVASPRSIEVTGAFIARRVDVPEDDAG